MPHIVSTITSDTSYCAYEDGKPGDPRRLKKQITIKGGHGVAGKKNLITPRGVITHVTDKDLEFLENSESFKRHKDRGFITVHNRTVEPEKAAKDMAEKDESAPKTPKDFEDQQVDGKDVKVKTGKPSKAK